MITDDRINIDICRSAGNQLLILDNLVTLEEKRLFGLFKTFDLEYKSILQSDESLIRFMIPGPDQDQNLDFKLIL